MAPSSFQSRISLTHITTATVILEIDGVAFLTDPVFGEPGIPHDITHLFPGVTERIVTASTEGPALGLDQLPPIDGILLSHEDHCDNLDDKGRQLLDGRRVITTLAGAKSLAPRPAVIGIRPWETQMHRFGGVEYSVTGTPCTHLPGGETTGFILHTERFGSTAGLPNVVWVPGDTIYLEEFAQVKKKFNVVVAVVNLGAAKVKWPGQEEPLQITMGGSDAARLVKEAGIEILVPVHYESWHHFTEMRKGLEDALAAGGVLDKVSWVELGVTKTII